MSADMIDPEIAERALAGELAALVDISSPSGGVPGAEAAIEVCIELLPDGMTIESQGYVAKACTTNGMLMANPLTGRAATIAY